MQVEAFAKVNLSLRVRPPDSSGLHPVRSLAQSIGWADRVSLDPAGEDGFVVSGPDEVPRDGSNLALQALEAVRSRAARSGPILLALEKHIPAAAGLGGGSADAAAVLALAAAHLGLEDVGRDALASGLGADVPFCLTGGTALVAGHGEEITSLPFAGGYALAVAVPPFRLPTAGVYRRWDEMEGPVGPGVAGRALPVLLREHAPLVNDLTPAALDLTPGLGDWIADLSRLWGTPVLMSGSGPALFSFFPTPGEAAAAAGAVKGSRGATAADPMSTGRGACPG